MKALYLKQGELAYSQEPAVIETVVGSCVAVVVWDKARQVGGACHFFLPYADQGTMAENNYGDFAIANLLRQFKAGGSKPADLVLKVVGGACYQEKGSQLAVGGSNAEAAESIITKMGLTITAKSVGGEQGKALRFNTQTGRLQVSPTKPLPYTNAQPIRVLIVDHNPEMRRLLVSILRQDKSFAVVGESPSPKTAAARIADLRPDVVTIDLNFAPRDFSPEDASEFIGVQLKRRAIPAILISENGPHECARTYAALEAGGFHFITKPAPAELGAGQEAFVDDLKQSLAAAAQRARQVRQLRPAPKVAAIDKSSVISCSGQRTSRCLLVVGASTGGTEALRSIFRSFGPEIPATVITLHIPPEFSKAFADRLNDECQFPVKEAKDGDIVRPNAVYIAPGGRHTKVLKIRDKLTIRLTDDPPINRFKPSVDYLFNSVATLNHAYVIAVLLTGMGVDGAKGMLSLKKEGYPTIAQDEATCAVFGMPKAAIDLKAADQVLGLEDIPAAIAKLLK